MLGPVAAGGADCGKDKSDFSDKRNSQGKNETYHWNGAMIMGEGENASGPSTWLERAG